MEPSTILAAMGGLAIFIIGYLLLGSGQSKAQKRVLSIGGRGGNDKSSIFSFMKVDDQSSRRKQIESSLEELEQNQKERVKAKKSLRAKLLHANLSTTPQNFIIMSAIIGAVTGGIPLLFGMSPLISIGIGFALGFGVPRWFLNMIITRRQKKFTALFADAMDIIVRGVRTGLPLGDCLRMIAHETPEPIQSEFRLLVEAESVGVPIEICIEKMFERMPLAEVNFFGTVLNIQRSTGGNLGESLDNLSTVLRERKLLREKIKAMSAEAKTSAIIIGVLPPGVMLMVSMSSPDYMMDLYTTKTGQTNLMISAVMMILGIVVMRKMINFKF
ncbi:MAG: type II secretion system F family protein [Robiginitomaculum sp.]|nr:type II secretion system F family protein [Robiginitomaculum sp.]